jgi:hypothetical protein
MQHGDTQTASLRFRIKLKAVPPVSFRTAIDRPCPLVHEVCNTLPGSNTTGLTSESDARIVVAR